MGNFSFLYMLFVCIVKQPVVCFSRIFRNTGILYDSGSGASPGDVIGAHFVLDDYHLYVDLDSCDSVVEPWCTQVNHHSTPSATLDKNKKQVPPSKEEITHFGCSCQISQALVRWIEKVNKLRQDMDDDTWAKLPPTLLTDYGQEVRKKWSKLAAKLGCQDKELHESGPPKEIQLTSCYPFLLLCTLVTL